MLLELELERLLPDLVPELGLGLAQRVRKALPV